MAIRRSKELNLEMKAEMKADNAKSLERPEVKDFEKGLAELSELYKKLFKKIRETSTEKILDRINKYEKGNYHGVTKEDVEKLKTESAEGNFILNNIERYINSESVLYPMKDFEHYNSFRLHENQKENKLFEIGFVGTNQRGFFGLEDKIGNKLRKLESISGKFKQSK